MFRTASRTTILLGAVYCGFFYAFRAESEHAHLEYSITQVDPTLGICSGYFAGDFSTRACSALFNVVGVDVVSGATPRSAPRKAPSQAKAPQTKTPQDTQQTTPQAADALTTRCEQEHQQAMRTTCTAAGQQQEQCAQAFQQYTHPAGRVPFEQHQGSGQYADPTKKQPAPNTKKDAPTKEKKQQDVPDASRPDAKATGCVTVQDAGDCAKVCQKNGYAEVPAVDQSNILGQHKTCTPAKKTEGKTYICRGNVQSQQQGPQNQQGPGGQQGPGQQGPGQQGAPQQAPKQQPQQQPSGQSAPQQPQSAPQSAQEPPPDPSLFKQPQKAKCGTLTVVPTKISAGESAELRWSGESELPMHAVIKTATRDVDTKRYVRGGLGIVEEESVEVSPESTTLYGYTLVNDAGSTQCGQTALLKVAPEEKKEETSEDVDEEIPEVLRCGATGGDGYATLAWSCPVGTRFSIATSDRDTTFTTEHRIRGELQVFPRGATTYTVRCMKNSVQELARDQCSIVSRPRLTERVRSWFNAKPVLELSADPKTVPYGTATRVTWNAVNTDTCELVNMTCVEREGGGSRCERYRGVNGYMYENIMQQTTYKLSCMQNGKEMHRSMSVFVAGIPPIQKPTPSSVQQKKKEEPKPSKGPAVEDEEPEDAPVILLKKPAARPTVIPKVIPQDEPDEEILDEDIE